MISSSSHETEYKTETDVITLSNHSCQSGSDDLRMESELKMETEEDDEVEAFPQIAPIVQDDSGALNRILTKLSTKSSWKEPGPPPDGGANAWLQVLMGHIVIFTTWGFINSFGVFETYYTATLKLSPSSVSWIGSVQVFLSFSLGTLAGRLSDGGFFRYILFLGSILQLLGVFLTSICTSYPTIFLTQGVLTGIGSGFLFCPTMAIVSTYFKKNKGLALGLSACGSATGGVVFPVMVQQLLPGLGFAWTMRCVGFVQLALLIVANAFLKPRMPPRKAGPWVEWAAFKEAEYTLFAVGMFFTFWGVYFAFYYISSYARSILGLSYSDSINLLLILNGVGVLGRILPNLLGDKLTGPLNILVPASLACILLTYAWIAISSVTGLYIWAVIYGVFGASIQGLFPFTLSTLTTDLRKAGTRMGMVFSIVAFSVLSGPPLAGALISADGASYLGAQLFAGTSLLVGCGFLIACRYVKSKGVLLVKV